MRWSSYNSVMTFGQLDAGTLLPLLAHSRSMYLTVKSGDIRDGIDRSNAELDTAMTLFSVRIFFRCLHNVMPNIPLFWQIKCGCPIHCKYLTNIGV